MLRIFKLLPLLLPITLSSCLKKQVKQSFTFNGNLLSACENPVPQANTLIKLYHSSGKGSPFFEEWTYETTTDINGNFTFVVNEENWEEDGKYDTDYAEVKNEKNQTIMSGIKPSNSNVGTIYYNDSRTIEIIFTADLSQLIPSDILNVNGLRFTPTNTTVSDTIYQYINNGFGQSTNAPFVDFYWQVHNSDTLRRGNTETILFKDFCQPSVTFTIKL